MMPTKLSKKLVDQCRELGERFYFEPTGSEIIGSFLQSDEENVYSKKWKKRKDGDRNVCKISSTTEIKGIRTYFKHLHCKIYSY